MISDKQTSARLFLVRHGEDLDNSRCLINGRRNSPLTRLGRTQALAVAEQICEEAISCVYTSPLQRARQTASIISKRSDITELHVESELIERDYGVLTGRLSADIPTYATEIRILDDFQYVVASPGIEEYPSLFARAKGALQRIQSRHVGEKILIVAHNEVIKMIRANFNGKSWEDELQVPPVKNCELITLG